MKKIQNNLDRQTKVKNVKKKKEKVIEGMAGWVRSTISRRGSNDNKRRSSSNNVGECQIASEVFYLVNIY